MDQDKIHFRKFLELCRQNGIFVWADPNLKRDKGTTGHWYGNDHIAVDRPNKKLTSISSKSSDDQISAFVDSSPDIKWEMAVLLHEYGHWFFKHPHPSTIDSTTAYQHEVEAWSKGEEVGLDVGIQDFSIFYADRDKSLLGYKIGFGIK